MNNNNTATQAPGAEPANRKPFLLFNDEIKADAYIRKINTFKNEIERFKPQFKAIVTENINVTLNKKWLNAIIDGNFEDKVNEAVAEYLQSQPKMLHSAIYKEFKAISEDLFKPAKLIKANFDNAINADFCPNGLERFESLPIDESGTFAITPQWEANARKQFEYYLTTDLQFKKYEAVKGCLKAQDEFKYIFGDHAPFAWNALNGNGFVTSNEVSEEHLNTLIKW